MPRLSSNVSVRRPPPQRPTTSRVLGAEPLDNCLRRAATPSYEFPVTHETEGQVSVLFGTTLVYSAQEYLSPNVIQEAIRVGHLRLGSEYPYGGGGTDEFSVAPRYRELGDGLEFEPADADEGEG